MKTFRKIVIVILTLLIISSALVSYASSAIRFSVGSPAFYGRVLPTLGAYDDTYELFSNYLLDTLNKVDMTDEEKNISKEVVHSAISKKEFNHLIGKAIGDGLGWVIYNYEDNEVPLKQMVEQLNAAIAADERVTSNENNLELILSSIVAQKLAVFIPSDEFGQTFRGYMYFYFTSGVQKYKDSFDFYVDEYIPYYTIKFNKLAYASIIATLLLLAILWIVNKNNKRYTAKLMQILCFVFAAFNIIGAIAFFSSPIVVNFSTKLASYSEYFVYIKPIFTSLGILALAYAVVLVIIGIIMKKLSKSALNENDIK